MHLTGLDLLFWVASFLGDVVPAVCALETSSGTRVSSVYRLPSLRASAERSRCFAFNGTEQEPSTSTPTGPSRSSIPYCKSGLCTK